MSWNVTKSGPPAEIKDKLIGDFENAKKATEAYPVESQTVGKAQEIVIAIIDEAIAGEKVATMSVVAYGSASVDWNAGNKPICTSFSLTVTHVYKS